jgi:hypothetical protein
MFFEMVERRRWRRHPSSGACPSVRDSSGSLPELKPPFSLLQGRSQGISKKWRAG